MIEPNFIQAESEIIFRTGITLFATPQIVRDTIASWFKHESIKNYFDIIICMHDAGNIFINADIRPITLLNVLRS